MAFKNRKAESKTQGTFTQTQQQSEFPDPTQSVKLPRKPFLLVVRDWLGSAFRSVFTPTAEMLVGYGIALSSVAVSIAGYYAIILPVATVLGFAGGKFFGVALFPLFLGAAKALIIQWKELAPKKFHLFRDLADRAAYKAGREVMVNPTESADKPSMLPTYKRLARTGDSLKAHQAKKERIICYVYEGVGAFIAIGALLGSTNPVIQVGAMVWAVYAIGGCEFGLNMSENAREHMLTATQERDYRVEKSRLQDQAQA